MNIVKLRKVRTPERISSQSCRLSFFAPEDEQFPMRLEAGESATIGLGIAVAVPDQHVLIPTGRMKPIYIHGEACTFIVDTCVADQDTKGELFVHVRNLSNDRIILRAGEKLTDFVLMPVCHTGINVLTHVTELYR